MVTHDGRAPSRPAGSKVGLVRLPVDAIRPAAENGLIYRPVTPDDPAIRELAQSVANFGVKEPLVVTRDGVILSGHRRHAASKLAGLAEVPCRVEPITSDDPRFESLLCEYNRQRVKGFDEVVREQLIFARSDPDAAYESLVEHRRAAAAVSGEFIDLGDVRRRKVISRLKRPMLDAVRAVVADKKGYWPISDREVHYNVLNDPPLRNINRPGSRYANDRDSYKDVTDIIARARLAGFIPFRAITDPTRTVETWSFLNRDVGEFVGQELERFLTGYWRDLMQGQPNHVEIVGEKNTISGSIHGLASKFCIPYTLGRGYCSVDPRERMCRRYKASGKSDLILLMMSDFDPEGVDIAQSFARSMRDDFGIRRVKAIQVCLTEEQVLERDLPKTFDIKKKSSRYKKFFAKHGDNAHELEALPTEERVRLLAEAIDSVIDVAAFNRQVEAEREDAGRIADLRKAVMPLIAAATRKSG